MLEDPNDAPAAFPRPHFPGFALPTSNTTYTPNQFFDVCLPHSSRGVVRLVAYMIRKTLGWCDPGGNPQSEQVLVSYRELSERAGIGNTMIRRAIDEAIAARLIRCVRAGRPNAAGKAAVSALYELRWVPGAEYVKDPKRFRGFFEGEGNRTDIPNQFFDLLIPSEPLTTVKVVGAVIRLSIGFADGRGRRRQQVSLSYQHIQNYTRIRNRTSLSQAIKQSIDRGYIVCVEPGLFDRNAGRTSKAATYSLRWADTPLPRTNGPKSVPARGPEKGTGNGPKGGPEQRSAKRTGIETKQGNETLQTQQQARLPVAAELLSVFNKLAEVGFDRKTAARLAAAFPPNRIEIQIDWLARRSPSRNPLGMLRRAIEEDWAEPLDPLATSQGLGHGLGGDFARHLYAGYADYRGEPTAEPTAADVASAERYVNRLLMVWPDRSRVVAWGRDFGRTTRDWQPPGVIPVVSAAYLLRAFGDRYLARHEAARQREIELARRASRSAREAQLRTAWIEHLRKEEQQFRTERPQDYAAFERHRSSERERIRSSPWQLDLQRELAAFDSEERRLRDFRQFFPEQVLDFWDWDREQNRTSPKSESEGREQAQSTN